MAASIFNGITADVGETVAVVIRGDGPNGVFRGRLCDVSGDAVKILLTVAVGPIPAGTFVAIRRSEIAAAARIEATL